MVIREGTAFEAVRAADLVPELDAAAFWRARSGRLVVEPAGRIRLPRTILTNRDRLPQPFATLPGAHRHEQFAAVSEFPPMAISKLESAYCLPFGAPMLAEQRKMVADYLIPWAPEIVSWFEHGGGSVYRARAGLDLARPTLTVETGFYLDHPAAWHYGHFIVDCLSRIYALDVCRAMFGDIKVILPATQQPDTFQARLLNAAGVSSTDIVKITGLVHCRRLLLATKAFDVLHYVSATAPPLWARLRDALSVRDISMPERVFFSRAAMSDRRLINEGAVERIFRRRGFAVVRPETLPIDMQVGLAGNARLVAGLNGSNMFNLAFQGRLRSVFVVAPEFHVRPSEQYFGAGHVGDLRYHIGSQVGPDVRLVERTWQVDTVRLETEVDDWLANVER